jgi:hypothetical protein
LVLIAIRQISPHLDLLVRFPKTGSHVSTKNLIRTTVAYPQVLNQ